MICKCVSNNNVEVAINDNDIEHCYVILKLHDKYWIIQSYIGFYSLEHEYAIEETNYHKILENLTNLNKFNKFIDTTNKLLNIWKNMTHIDYNYYSNNKYNVYINGKCLIK